MWLYSDGSQIIKHYCNCYTMAQRAGGLQSTKRQLLWAELSFSVTFPGCGCWLHSQSLKTEPGNTVELQLQGGSGGNHSVQCFPFLLLTRRGRCAINMAQTKCVCLTAKSFFQVWLLWSSCQSWSKLTVPSGYKDSSYTLVLHSQLSQQCCFHTAGSLLAISHTPLPPCTQWQAPWLPRNTKKHGFFSSEGTHSFRGMPPLVSFLLMVAAL